MWQGRRVWQQCVRLTTRVPSSHRARQREARRRRCVAKTPTRLVRRHDEKHGGTGAWPRGQPELQTQGLGCRINGIASRSNHQLCPRTWGLQNPQCHGRVRDLEKHTPDNLPTPDCTQSTRALQAAVCTPSSARGERATSKFSGASKRLSASALGVLSAAGRCRRPPG